jgi:hypothetical protein
MTIKDDIEIKYLKKEIALIPWRFIVTISSVLLIIAGFAFERYQAFYEQRWQIQQSVLSSEIERMTVIATEFDKLYTETLSTLKKEEKKPLFLYVYLDQLANDIEGIDIEENEKLKILSILGEYKKGIDDGKFSIDEYASAVSLQEKWEAYRPGISPDIDHYYGQGIKSLWEDVVDSAWKALNVKFNIFSDGDETPAIGNFRLKGKEFQKFLRLQIRKRREKMQN